MRLTQKQTCSTCRAMKDEGAYSFSCTLGYELKVLKDKIGFCYIIPQEPCPKPTTWGDLAKASEHLKKGK